MKRFIKIFRRRPVVLLFIQLVQDLDLLMPIAVSLQQNHLLDFKVMATDWVLEKSPRIRSTFSALGIPLRTISRKAFLRGIRPRLFGVHALITATESTAGPHRVAHALVKHANTLGIKTYTLQHGYENIGLNYSDSAYPLDTIRFASQHILLWGSTSQLPENLALETREKCISVGCSKPMKPYGPLPEIQHTGIHLVAVFENLHWERYSDDYRQKTLQDLETTARRFPQVTFLVKPHHAGLWLTKQDQELLPQASNIRVIDPRLEEWQAYTAPFLIALADAAISTPSTVALDAARLDKPVAVVGYDLDLANYEPLLILQGTQDWITFVDQICIEKNASLLKQRSRDFIEQCLVPGDGVALILDRLILDICK